MNSNEINYRLHLIFQLFQKDSPGYTLDQICLGLKSYGIDYNYQKWKRDREYMGEYFSIFFDYDDKQMLYSIDLVGAGVNRLMSYLDVICAADYLKAAIDKNPRSLEVIQFDSSPIQLGLDYLEPLLYAINERRFISFRHENYYNQTLKDYHVVEPLLLKEYLERWYLVAFVPAIEELRTFGLDRIKDLKTKEGNFPDRKIDVKDRFSQIIGLNYSDSETLIVKLAYTEQQWKYQKAKPLHRSQKETDEYYSDSHPIVVKYFLKPNFELKQQLLALGSQVIVIQPKNLRRQIINELEGNLKNY